MGPHAAPTYPRSVNAQLAPRPAPGLGQDPRNAPPQQAPSSGPSASTIASTQDQTGPGSGSGASAGGIAGGIALMVLGVGVTGGAAYLGYRIGKIDKHPAVGAAIGGTAAGLLVGIPLVVMGGLVVLASTVPASSLP